MELVEITVVEGGNYIDSVKDGRSFTSVRYDGKNYGGSSPCDNAEEISSAIKHAKETIIDAGDKPKVTDKREKALLSHWL